MSCYICEEIKTGRSIATFFDPDIGLMTEIKLEVEQTDALQPVLKTLLFKTVKDEDGIINSNQICEIHLPIDYCPWCKDSLKDVYKRRIFHA